MKKLSLLLIMVLFAMTASAYTFYSNVEIGNFKYSQLALGSSSSEENIAYLKGLSSTASTSLTTLDIPGYVTYNGNRYRNHTPPPFGHLLYLRGGVFIRLSILTQLPGGSMKTHVVDYHTPQSLCDSSSILEEQLIHSNLFSSNSR